MVLKQIDGSRIFLVFENDVEMYGAQTKYSLYVTKQGFENDVEMYGAQTTDATGHRKRMFENDVEMYGAQTIKLFGTV